MFRERGNLYIEEGRNGDRSIKNRKSNWWRWNQTRDVESIEQWRNSLANSSGVTSYVEVFPRGGGRATQKRQKTTKKDQKTALLSLYLQYYIRSMYKIYKI